MKTGRRPVPSCCTNQKKTAMLTSVRSTATITSSSGTRTVSIRPSALSVNVYANTKMPTDTLSTGRAKTRLMMRGVSWPLAIWTASRRPDTANTMKVSIDEDSPPRMACAPSTLNPNQRHCVRMSSQSTSRMTGTAATIASAGTIQKLCAAKCRRW